MGKRIVKSFDELGFDRYGSEWIGGDAVVEAMSKALAQGAIAGYGDATPLRLENLDGTMTQVLFQESHLKLFNAIPRVPSAQSYYQWIRELQYGTQRGNPGFREGGVPQGGISKWERGNATNKYLGVRRGYTHQALVTGNMGGMFVDPVARENRNGTRQILAMIERNVIFGDKLILDKDGNETNYDGMLKQMLASAGATTNIVDKKGLPLDFEDLENAGEQLVTKGKLLNFDNIRTYWTPRVLSDLAKLKLQAERRILGQDTIPGYRPGTPLEGFRTQHGYLGFEDSIFLDAVEDGKPNATADPDSAPAPGTVTMAVGSAGTAPLMTAMVVYYTAAAINDAGESIGTTSAASVANEAGKKTTVTIARVTSGNCTGYRVYRGLASNGSDAGYIGVVPQPGSGDATFDDLNAVIPGTGMGIIANLQEEDVALAQMSPLVKFPLAQVTTTIEFLLLLYHVIVVKAWERVIIYRNIGKRTD